MLRLFFLVLAGADFLFFMGFLFFSGSGGPDYFFSQDPFFFLDLGPRPTAPQGAKKIWQKAPQGPKNGAKGPAGREKLGEKAPQGPKNGKMPRRARKMKNKAPQGPKNWKIGPAGPEKWILGVFWGYFFLGFFWSPEYHFRVARRADFLFFFCPNLFFFSGSGGGLFFSGLFFQGS